MIRSQGRDGPSVLRDVAAIVFAGLLLLVPGAAFVDLFNPDEPREAEIAREMGVSGDRLVPHFNGCPFLEKPPLFYWSVLASSRIPGLGAELAARLPSVLAGLGLLIVVYGLGRELYDRRTGRAAALLLLTTFEFWWLGKRALLDMPLAFFIGAALLFFLMADRRPTARVRWLMLAGVAAAGAVLTKGLIGLLIPGLAIVTYELWRRRPRALVSPWLLAAGVIPLIALGVWVGLLGGRPDGSCFIREFLIENHVKRFLGQGYGGHQQAPWYYLGSLATDYQPWSLFLPGALIALWPGRRSRDPFLHAWIIPALLVLSVSGSKRSIYLLPLAAPMALLVAAWWRRRRGRDSRPAGPSYEGGGGSDVTSESEGRSGVRPTGASRVSGEPGGRGLDLLVPGIVLAGIGVIVSLALPVLIAALLSDHPPSSARAAVNAFVRVPWSAGFGVVLLVAIIRIALLARRSTRRAGGATLKLAGALLFVAGILILPLAGPLVSARRLGEVLEHERENGTRLAASGISEGSLGQFLFYSGGTMDWLRPGSRKPESACTDCRLLTSPEVWLAGPGPRACLLTRPDFDRLTPALEGGRIVFEDVIGGADYVLVSKGP